MLDAQIYAQEPRFKHLGLHTLFLLSTPLKRGKQLPLLLTTIINPSNLKIVYFVMNQLINSVC